MKTEIRQHQVRGETKWVVVQWRDGHRKRTHFDTEAEAIAERDRLAAAPKAMPDLTADQIALVLKRYGREPETRESPTLDRVIDELLRVKRNNGHSERYAYTVELLLNQFSKGRESLEIHQVTPDAIQAHLNAYKLCSRPTIRARLSMLFRFALRRRYIASNPCDALDPIIWRRPAPRILTPDQLQTVLDYLGAGQYRHALGWFVLSCCCGLRPEEAMQIVPGDILADEGCIVVRPEISKKRQRRPVYPLPEAMRLLAAVLPVSRLPLHPAAKKRALHALRRLLGWDRWPKDVTRHSAASYWLAVVQDSAAVALSLGNSEAELLGDYRAIVTRCQAEAWWQIVGSWTIQPGKENI